MSWLYFFVQSFNYHTVYIYIQQTTVLYVIMRYKNDFTNFYYSLVVALSITDLVAIFYLLHCFISCYYSSNYLGTTAHIIVTSINSCAYCIMLYLTVAVSVNRLTAIVTYAAYDKIWSPNKTITVIMDVY